MNNDASNIILGGTSATEESLRKADEGIEPTQTHSPIGHDVARAMVEEEIEKSGLKILHKAFAFVGRAASRTTRAVLSFVVGPRDENNPGPFLSSFPCRLVFMNEHNKTKAFEGVIGSHCWACGNGQLLGSLRRLAKRHTGNIIKKVRDVISYILTKGVEAFHLWVRSQVIPIWSMPVDRTAGVAAIADLRQYSRTGRSNVVGIRRAGSTQSEVIMRLVTPTGKDTVSRLDPAKLRSSILSMDRAETFLTPTMRDRILVSSPADLVAAFRDTGLELVDKTGYHYQAGSGWGCGSFRQREANLALDFYDNPEIPAQAEGWLKAGYTEWSGARLVNAITAAQKHQAARTDSVPLPEDQAAVDAYITRRLQLRKVA